MLTMQEHESLGLRGWGKGKVGFRIGGREKEGSGPIFLSTLQEQKGQQLRQGTDKLEHQVQKE
jgi:hypothetical protein